MNWSIKSNGGKFISELIFPEYDSWLEIATFDQDTVFQSIDNWYNSNFPLIFSNFVQIKLSTLKLLSLFCFTLVNMIFQWTTRSNDWIDLAIPPLIK